MDENRPGYYAIIPADVRYDPEIPPNAKLLYGEISSLIGPEGFCYASNQYFAEIYGFTQTTVSKLVAKLEKAGYIKRELEKDNSGQVVRRRLYLSVSMPDVQPLVNFDNTSPQNSQGGIVQKDKYTNIDDNIYIGDAPKRGKSVPLSDTEMQSLFVEWIKKAAAEDWTAQAKNEVYIALCGFYAPRENKKQEPARTKAGFTALANRLVRFSDGSHTAMIDLLELATSAGWKSVYEPKGKGGNKPPENRRDVEWI